MPAKQASNFPFTCQLMRAMLASMMSGQHGGARSRPLSLAEGTGTGSLAHCEACIAQAEKRGGCHWRRSEMGAIERGCRALRVYPVGDGTTV